MLIFGHRFLDTQSFFHIQSIEAIENTPPSSTIFVEFLESNLDIIKHLKNNQINFTLGVKNIEELIYASALEASFILVPKEILLSAQNIANNYLFDAKILVMITDESEIETMATSGVDGVIFSNAIVKINS